MVTAREVKGTEFDWFARDSDGNFAVFATAGFGPIPDLALTDSAEHDKFGESLEIIGWGTAEVWSSYVRVGLFAYDWNDEKGGYLLVGTPS